MKKISLALLLSGFIGVLFAVPKPQDLCTGCHGTQGISPNPSWPHLAGQHPSYFLKQWQDLQKGNERNIPVMATVLSQLTEKEAQELAQFYANQPLPPKSIIPFRKQGEILYRRGDFSKRIPACITCHGPHAEGNAQTGFPKLNGQNAKYTVAQLQAFQEKRRKNDLNAIMQSICAQMSAQEMEDVAYYIQGLD